MRHLIVAVLLVVFTLAPWLALNYPAEMQYLAETLTDAADQLAAVVVHNPKTIAGLQSKYNIDAARGTAKIRVLIVPGHEPEYGGAEFGSLKERKMTVELSERLAQILRNNGRYEVFVTRDATSWSPELSSYFKDSWPDIVDWKNSYKQEAINLAELTGTGPTKPRVYHNNAPDNVALRLYGITKWSNDNNIDIVIHAHFNDYPGHPRGRPGKYGGFAIYVPEQQFSNSTTTRAIAESVFRRLAKYNPVSNLEGESDGIIEEPDLIAVGAYNTSDAASMLIEYGYIYEPQFANEDTRDLAIGDLAFQTYLGMQDFFGHGAESALVYDTLMLPYRWQREMSAKSNQGTDILALQTALSFNGLYPPGKKSKSDCPRTGSFGGCTKAAVEIFQKKFNISEEKGMVGPKTLEALNREFGTRAD